MKQLAQGYPAGVWLHQEARSLSDSKAITFTDSALVPSPGVQPEVALDLARPRQSLASCHFCLFTTLDSNVLPLSEHFSPSQVC